MERKLLLKTIKKNVLHNNRAHYEMLMIKFHGRTPKIATIKRLFPPIRLFSRRSSIHSMRKTHVEGTRWKGRNIYRRCYNNTYTSPYQSPTFLEKYKTQFISLPLLTSRADLGFTTLRRNKAIEIHYLYAIRISSLIFARCLCASPVVWIR